MTQSSRRVSGPISDPSPTTVLPSRSVPGYSVTSRPKRTVTSMNVWRGIEHRHAVQQPVTVGARPQLALGQGELPAVVDALRLLAGRLHPADAVAHPGQHADDVGQVELALRVVRRQVPQGRAEQVPPERVDAGGDLVDGPFLHRRVALLDDPQHPAVGRGDDPPVARRVVDDAREQRRRGAVGDVASRRAPRSCPPAAAACRRGARRSSSRRRGRRRGTRSCRSPPRRRCPAGWPARRTRRWPTAGPAPAPSW